MKIGIVDDLSTAAEAMRRALALRPRHQVVWRASNGLEAVERCLKDTPDLVLMDLNMPLMDGVEATREIMRRCPCAIVIVTASVSESAGKVFEAMSLGALDAVDTPTLRGDDSQKGAAMLLAKIDILERLIEDAKKPREPAQTSICPLVAIGASAGGPGAVAAILRQLPKTFPAAIVVVQHIDQQFAPSLTAWLNGQSALPVVGACDGDRPSPGKVLLAVKEDHLVVGRSGKLEYTEHPKETFYRPSVDAFFQSAAKNWTGEIIGLLLTGMGRDGARGLKQLRDLGAHTITQDQATSAVYGMPQAAAQLDAAVEILPLDKIALALEQRLRKGSGGNKEKRVWE